MCGYLLGEWVQVRRIVVAQKEWNDSTRQMERKWVRRDKELVGIVVGRRFVKEGVVDYTLDGVVFHSTKTIACYEVAYDLYRKPVHVLVEDMEHLSRGT